MSPPDLFDPATFAAGVPHEHFRRLRDHEPVAWTPEGVRSVTGMYDKEVREIRGPGFWSVTRYADAAEVDRAPNEHLAFGVGPHFCLGAHLARRQLHAVFRELLTRLPDIGVAGPVRRMHSSFINGYQHLPVAFTPAPR